MRGLVQLAMVLEGIMICASLVLLTIHVRRGKPPLGAGAVVGTLNYEGGRMKRGAVVGLALCLIVGLAAPAGAAIKIKKISFDPAGNDDGTNRNLNKEWIYIVNTGPNDVQMRDWKIVDNGRDHVFRFLPLLLSPGDTVRLHTGQGGGGAPGCEEGTECPENAHYDEYWDLDNYVWNNDGDRARLIRPNGTIVDSCAYTASADSPRVC